MSDVADFSLLNDDEKADLERVHLAITEGEQLKAMSAPAGKEWRESYARGVAGRNAPLERKPESPPLSLALIAHFAYLDRLINGIKELDTAQSEQRIRRAHLLLIKGGRRDAR
jgi:hypothetical protein